MKLGFKVIKGHYGDIVHAVVAEDCYKIVNGEIVNIKGEIIDGVQSCEVSSALDNLTHVTITYLCYQSTEHLIKTTPNKI